MTETKIKIPDDPYALGVLGQLKWNCNPCVDSLKSDALRDTGQRWWST